MSAKKTAKKASKKSVSRDPARKAARKRAEPSPVVKHGKKKMESAPSNVTQMPGKFAQFAEKVGPSVKEQGKKFLKEHGAVVARAALGALAKQAKHPTLKKGIIFLHDIIP